MGQKRCGKKKKPIVWHKLANHRNLRKTLKEPAGVDGRPQPVLLKEVMAALSVQAEAGMLIVPLAAADMPCYSAETVPRRSITRY